MVASAPVTCHCSLYSYVGCLFGTFVVLLLHRRRTLPQYGCFSLSPSVFAASLPPGTRRCSHMLTAAAILLACRCGVAWRSGLVHSDAVGASVVEWLSAQCHDGTRRSSAPRSLSQLPSPPLWGESFVRANRALQRDPKSLISRGLATLRIRPGGHESSGPCTPICIPFSF